MSNGTPAPIWAAGAVPLRGVDDEREVLLVHRPAYDDWTLPKGKARSRELLPSTAVREVGEEASAKIRLGSPLTPVRYPISQRMKIVSWWVGVTLSSTKHSANEEVDKAKWMNPDKALTTLTYADEREILTEALTLPSTTPMIILRHAKAKNREGWRKADHLRPLSSQGRSQLSYVSQILSPFGVTKLVSSSATRCVSTLQEYAKAQGLKITTTEGLTEEKATERETGAYMQRLALKVGSSGKPTVVCGHRPVIPTMLTSLGIQVRPLSTASCVILHLDTHGKVITTEWHDTLRVKI
ncbi:MAG: NUDIX hydrolase [Propionibacteriaceae bacterium]|nr:NUDIX hydrolase [Propionibacteriaceae bacterium]